MFYFGLIFFALDLISVSLLPMRDRPLMRQVLAYAREPWLGVLVGISITVIVQSSSVTTGLAILLVQQGMLSLEAAISIAALIVSTVMSPAARATAWSNLFFNFSGVLAFAPFLRPFAGWVGASAGGPGSAVALAHLLFNATMSLAFLLLLPRVAPALERYFRLRAPKEDVGYIF